MSKKYYSLCGLPRSGSTLLGSLLNQHPLIHCSQTSCVLDVLSDASDSIYKHRNTYAISEAQEIKTYKSILDSFYMDINKPIIFDKHRGWPKSTRRHTITGQKKMICTMRRISEIVASYITLLNNTEVGSSFVDKHLNSVYRPITTRNRAMMVWEGYMLKPYNIVKDALATCSEDMLLITYDDLCHNPDEQMHRISTFFDIPAYNDYNYLDIEHINIERDEAGWGIKGLHDIRKQLKRTSKPAETIIGEELTAYFNTYNL